MVGINGLTGFSYFRKMMSYVFRGYYDVIVVLICLFIVSET